MGLNRIRRVVRSSAACAVCVGWLLLSATAVAAERVALVIGNGAYKSTPALPNPPNDATDMAQVLEEELGFEVLLHHDLDEVAMEAALSAFGRKAERADLALVFFAGHGIEFNGQSYLLPVDAPPLTHERQLRRLMRLDDLVAEAAYARVGIVLVDACRDNPLANNLRAALGASRSAAVGRGLSKLEESPAQTLVVYATQAGAVADDDSGNGRNSPFTVGLLTHLATPGLEVSLLVRRVRDEVLRLTGNRQQPFDYGSLGGDPIYLAGGAAPLPTPGPVPVPPMTHVELTVRPSPDDARVRIMNIAEAYRDRIALEADAEYDIEVSAPGYETYRQRQSFKAGRRELAVTLTAQRTLAHGEVIRDRLADGSEGPAMVFLRGGSFLMGSSEGEDGRYGNEKQHQVAVSDVLIARTEVTVGEFRRFVQSSGYRTDAERNAGGWNGCFAMDVSDGQSDWRSGRSWRTPGFSQGEGEPVVCVSWNDAQAYVAWLSSQTGETYQLPTEAEWEYAARAGTTSSRFWGDDPDRACDYANVADLSAQRKLSWSGVHGCDDGHVWTAPVNSYRPNPWGLSDMLGNVWEWTCSVYNEAYGGAEGRCDASGEARAARGGAWMEHPANVRAAYRGGGVSDSRFRLNTVGFRSARSP